MYLFINCPIVLKKRHFLLLRSMILDIFTNKIFDVISILFIVIKCQDMPCEKRATGRRETT